MKKAHNIVFFLSLVTILGITQSASAAPIVTSFTATPTEANSGQSVSLVWTIEDGGGHVLRFTCVDGIKATKDTGQIVNCNTAISADDSASSGMTLVLKNISGATRAITFTLTPKDGSGTEYPAFAKTRQVTIYPILHPITSFTTSSTDETGKNITFTWKTEAIDGVNMIIECKDGIRASAPSYSETPYLPCGIVAFPSQLSADSSIDITFSNNPHIGSVPLTVRLIPAITSTTYDAIHAKSVVVDVPSDITPDPTVSSFTHSDTYAVSKKPITFAWTSKNDHGVNFIFGCMDSITVATTTTLATSTLVGKPLPCGSKVFPSNLVGATSTTFVFTNTSTGLREVPVSIFLANKKAELINGNKSLKVVVKTEAQAEADKAAAALAALKNTATAKPQTTVVKTTTTTKPPTTTTTTRTTTATAPVKKVTFTRYLTRGSSGADVTLLQTLLKKETGGVYPEGVISGYFGPATEAAVKRFQSKYNLVRKTDPLYGSVGLRTREKLNTLIK